ncbi:hypothetical protein [Lacticaseibacillus paracasei]|uniref:hypothetical protein n=1 Tax=Lacticaseibacillus paracasei TaxID=1597 RepID=UPI0024782D3B|nr:hypothetical protein [Lacticaseibacillus paracasei]MDH7451360.1 hypothetical protein [Lacticaseibacillus paracasei subsp. paracasei]
MRATYFREWTVSDISKPVRLGWMSTSISQKMQKYFRQEDFKPLKANEIFPGDIVVCRLADPAGRAVILPNIGKQMVTSVDVAIFAS